MRHLELISATPIKCYRLNRGLSKDVEAIVQNFKDGTTKVLCPQMDTNGQCTLVKKVSSLPINHQNISQTENCTYLVNSSDNSV